MANVPPCCIKDHLGMHASDCPERNRVISNGAVPSYYRPTRGPEYDPRDVHGSHVRLHKYLSSSVGMNDFAVVERFEKQRMAMEARATSLMAHSTLQRFEDHLTQEIGYRLQTWVLKGEEVQWPKTAWDHVKHQYAKWFPKWFLKRYPAQYEKRNLVCPHIMAHDNAPHVEFLRMKHEDRF